MLSSLLLLAAQQATPWSETPSLSPDSLRADLEFLADDQMHGRRTGELGARVAATWIQSRFLRAGLQPMTAAGADAPNWVQEFPSEPVHLDADRTYLTIGEQRIDAGYDFLPHPSSPEGTVSGDIVFVGWGIHAPEREYSDFDGVDLEGKVAVLFRWEPGASQSDHPWDGLRMIPQAALAQKVEQCVKRGAIAVLAATPPDDLQKQKATGQPYWPAHSEMWRMLNSEPIRRQMMADDSLAKTNFTAEDAVGQAFTISQNNSPFGAEVPVGYISPRVMRGLLRKMGVETKEWVETSSKQLQPDSFDLAIKGVTVSVGKQAVDLVGRNIIGMLPGRDPELAKEYIVIGAHFDHVGFNDEGEIWNGADDNGSGTVALLGVLDAIAALPQEQRPKRSVIFVAFSGEELGLIGSYQFLAGGYVEPEDIAAMVNLDMIGRAVESSVYVVGTKSGQGLAELIQNQGEGVDLKLRFDNEEFFDRSDQVGFYYAGVPIVFFNTDEHDDYHTPRDTADLIHYDDMAGIATVAYRTLRALADREERIPFLDAYDRLQPIYGQSLTTLVFPVRWPDRLDY